MGHTTVKRIAPLPEIIPSISLVIYANPVVLCSASQEGIKRALNCRFADFGGEVPRWPISGYERFKIQFA